MEQEGAHRLNQVPSDSYPNRRANERGRGGGVHPAGQECRKTQSCDTQDARWNAVGSFSCGGGSSQSLWVWTKKEKHFSLFYFHLFFSLLFETLFDSRSPKLDPGREQNLAC